MKGTKKKENKKLKTKQKLTPGSLFLLIIHDSNMIYLEEQNILLRLNQLTIKIQNFTR